MLDMGNKGPVDVYDVERTVTLIFAGVVWQSFALYGKFLAFTIHGMMDWQLMIQDQLLGPIEPSKHRMADHWKKSVAQQGINTAWVWVDRG